MNSDHCAQMLNFRFGLAADEKCIIHFCCHLICTRTNFVAEIGTQSKNQRKKKTLKKRTQCGENRERMAVKFGMSC